MKYAIVNNELQEAQPGLSGTCPCCDSPVIAKCGDIKIEHWSHFKVRRCDPWWENETEWHRSWKSHFPKEWQEVVHRADGEKHIADVKTDKNWTLEFQYSAISSNERHLRNRFYGKIVWVVNGLRRKRDPVQFFSSLKVVGSLENQIVRRVCDVVSDKSALLRDWGNHSVPVLFDFLEPNVIWCLLPKKPESQFVVLEVSRQEFIRMHQLNADSVRDNFNDFIQFFGAATSAADLIERINTLKREEERRRQLMADEARRRNPYINRRAFRRL